MSFTVLFFISACEDTTTKNTISNKYGSFSSERVYTSEIYGFSLKVPKPYSFQYYASHIWGNPQTNKINGGDCYLLSKEGIRIGQFCLTINPEQLSLEKWTKLNYDEKEGSEIKVQGKNNLYVFDFDFDDDKFEKYEEVVTSEVLSGVEFFDVN
jgi:hypothetical protein